MRILWPITWRLMQSASVPCVSWRIKVTAQIRHKPEKTKGLHFVQALGFVWLRGLDLNQRPSGYEPDELPDCSTPRHSVEDMDPGADQAAQNGTHTENELLSRTPRHEILHVPQKSCQEGPRRSAQSPAHPSGRLIASARQAAPAAPLLHLLGEPSSRNPILLHLRPRHYPQDSAGRLTRARLLRFLRGDPLSQSPPRSRHDSDLG